MKHLAHYLREGKHSTVVAYITNYPQYAIILRAGTPESSTVGAVPTPHGAPKHLRVSSPHFCFALLIKEVQAGDWRPGRLPETRGTAATCSIPVNLEKQP